MVCFRICPLAAAEAVAAVEALVAGTVADGDVPADIAKGVKPCQFTQSESNTAKVESTRGSMACRLWRGPRNAFVANKN